VEPPGDEQGAAVGTPDIGIPRPRAGLGSGEFLVTGAVLTPGTAVSTTDLDRRASGPQRVRYVTRTCDQVDTVYRVALHDVLSGIGLQLRADRKMDHQPTTARNSPHLPPTSRRRAEQPSHPTKVAALPRNPDTKPRCGRWCRVKGSPKGSRAATRSALYAARPAIGH
jgi:hypothetical protein